MEKSKLSWDGDQFATMTITSPDEQQRTVTPEIWKLLTEKQWDELYLLTELIISQPLANKIIRLATVNA
jgi:hypothetical protein